MRKRELERFRRKLLKMREEILEELKQFEQEKLEQNMRERLGQVSAFTTHPADIGSVTDEQERAFLLAAHKQKILDAVDEALFRIEQGTYGKCRGCGKNIEMERLKAIPYAEYCLSCQEKIENEGVPSQSRILG
ncbi:TraR/DksA C4-type zinc finger protein [bacterium]|nr:TraR/DksA C4-type zinc finger protein [bacterium]